MAIFGSEDRRKDHDPSSIPLLSTGSSSDLRNITSHSLNPRADLSSYADSDLSNPPENDSLEDDDEEEDFEPSRPYGRRKEVPEWKMVVIWKWVFVVISIWVGVISGVLLAKYTHARRPNFSTIPKALDIPPFPHFGNASEVGIRQHTLWGSGLSHAVQNQESTFYIDFLDIWGKNSSSSNPVAHDEDIYVLLSGPTLLSATVTYTTPGRYRASYTVMDAGTYNLRVDLFKRHSKLGYPWQYWTSLGEPGGYEVVVTRADGSVLEGDGRAEVKIPKERCRGLDNAEGGKWVRCEDVGVSCVRWGWIFTPRDCYYELYSPAEIKAKPFWILFVGTSVKRGTFFAGLDYLLGEAAAKVATSKFWRCWGFMDMQIDKFRLSYLDYRRQCYLPWLHCGTSEYPDAADEMFWKLGRDNGGPDLVVLEINQNWQKNYDEIGALVEAFGPAWKGVAVAGYRFRSPERQWVGWYPEQFDLLEQTLKNNSWPQVKYQDLSWPSEPWFNQMEYPLQKNGSFHWHRGCDENNMHVCSPVPDMEFHSLISYAMQLPDRKSYAHSSQFPTIDNTNVVPGNGTKFCLQCPNGLDNSMRPNETVTCYEELPPQ